MFEVLYLLMQGNIIHIGADGLSGSRTQPDNFQASSIDLVSQLVYRNIRRSAHQHLSNFLLDKMVHKSGGGDCLSGSWGSLNQC